MRLDLPPSTHFSSKLQLTMNLVAQGLKVRKEVKETMKVKTMRHCNVADRVTECLR